MWDTPDVGFFALVRSNNESRILCSNLEGYSLLFDADSHSTV
jgi:hypothetical protein